MKKLLSTFLSLSLLLPLASPAAAADAPISREIADYAGRGSVIAMIGTGFYTDHPVFAESPDSPRLYREYVEEFLYDAYLSDKIPAAWDFVDDDGDVSHASHVGTSAASLAAGMFTGAGDVIHEDGTVTHEASFMGAAPHAQLLLFKAAPDTSVKLDSSAAAEAIQTALALGADAIWLDTAGLKRTSALLSALNNAHNAGVPILVGAGDAAENTAEISTLCTDRGVFEEYASWPALTLVGAAADPYDGITAFTLSAEGAEDLSVSYTDSCEDYFGEPFAAILGGTTLPITVVPGIGSAEDYKGINAAGAAAVVMRGEITFLDKAKAAAEAGAAAMIVIDNGSGLSRMALEDSPIPAVMISAEDGEKLIAAKNASLSFEEGKYAAASFSATGVTSDLIAAPAFLCAAQRVLAAITPSEITSDAYYARVSGTRFAAAAAAGYTARAAEFCRADNLETSLALSLAVSAARTVTDDNGVPLSIREVGRGIVSDKGSYTASLLTGEDHAITAVCGEMRYSEVSFTLYLKNDSAQRKRYSISLTAFHEGYEIREDGSAVLTGNAVTLDAARAYVGDGSTNICREPVRVTVAAGMSITIPVKIVVPENKITDQKSVFPYGFHMDGSLTVTDDDGAADSFPYTAFIGEWSSAPLADATVFDDAKPLLKATRLAVRRFEQSDKGYALPLGSINPYNSESPYSESASVVNPDGLRLGWIEIELVALRDIDEITLTFYDSGNRIAIRRDLGSAAKYIADGTAVLPLWDFTAADFPDYIFPDGEYRCEIRLAADFGKAGKTEQILNFTVIADSEKPTAQITAKKEGDQTLLIVTAEDNRALMDVTVYDSVFTYAAKEGASTCGAGEKTVTMTFDITQYDGFTPLYAEITDRAGSRKTLRFTEEMIEAMLQP